MIAKWSTFRIAAYGALIGGGLLVPLLSLSYSTPLDTMWDHLSRILAGALGGAIICIAVIEVGKRSSHVLRD